MVHHLSGIFLQSRVWLGQGSDWISVLTIYCNFDFVHIAYLHNVNVNLTTDQIVGTDKEHLCISKIVKGGGWYSMLCVLTYRSNSYVTDCSTGTGII